jgi:5-formyltetrahydrofolate cyclo-ligase
MTQEKKRQLRQVLIKKLKSHKEDERLKKSSRIAEKLFLLKEYIQAKTVLYYISLDGEVETVRMIKKSIEQGKRVAVPVVRKETREIIPSLLKDYDGELTRGPHGTRHPKEEYIRPISLESLDLVVVPGLAFDEAGNRLGRGMGYYDRFLGRLPKNIPTVGLAFDFQVVSDFPPLEPHDFSVSKVLSA